MIIHKIIDTNKEFLKSSPNIYFSPGRVNLIGEYVDFLGGNVFPTAIDLGTYAFVSKRDDIELHFFSENFKDKGVIVADLDDLVFKEEDDWTNYCKGMFEYYKKTKVEFFHGYNILIYGTLPNGAGLSSSASLEVLIGTVIKEELQLDISMKEIVLMAQQVENNFVGVNCGIMDQFAVGMSKKDSAIYLNTDTLEYRLVPLDTKTYTLVIANTNKKRALSDSSYNERRNQCDIGLKTLQDNNVDINQICDMDVALFEQVKSLIKDDVIRNRVEHAVYENERTKQAVEALESNDLLRFGKLMDKSHDSLKDLFEVSCEELDILVNAFRSNNSIGARMTGAGFGGCAITLIETAKLEETLKNVQEIYFNKVGYKADFYPVKTHDGASKITLEELK
jgi:galactokinase